MKERKLSATMSEKSQFISEGKLEKIQAPKDVNEISNAEKMRCKTILRKKGTPAFKSSHLR